MQTEMRINPVDLSIIIVNFNSGNLLRITLDSLIANVQVPYEIIIVDNASSDGSIENLPHFQELTVLRVKENLGFARACNLGARKAKGRIFHFLNPDARVTGNINLCYDSAMASCAEIFVTSILDTRRATDRSRYPVPTLGNIIRVLFFPKKVNYWYLGASVVVPASIFDRLGGWSEDYFMYAEDLDFFYKAFLAGIPTRVSSSLVIHDQGGTTRNIWTDYERKVRTEKATFIFVRKFGLKFDYFVFRHLALLKVFWRDPRQAAVEFCIFWQELLASIVRKTSL